MTAKSDELVDELVSAVIACCTYNSNAEAMAGAYGISYRAFTMIDNFIKNYNHAVLDGKASTDVKTSTDNNKCWWTQESDPEVFPNLWRAGCGNSFWLDAEKPSDNHMKYCCYCGKEIAEG